MTEGDRQVYIMFQQLSSKYTKLQEEINYLVEILQAHNSDSRKYLDKFYNKCKNNCVDELNWVECDDTYMDFVNQQGVEYNRIYDIAILNITEKLLAILQDKSPTTQVEEK